MIDASIIQDRDLLDSVIMNNKITISEMPAIQLSALILENNEVFEQLKKRIKNDIF